MKNRIKALYAILIFLAAEAIQIVVVGGLQVFYGLLVAIHMIQGNREKGLPGTTDFASAIESGMSQDIIYLISVIGVMACGIAFFFWYRHEIKWERRGSIKKVFTVKNIILLISLGIGCQFFISGAMSMVQRYFSGLFEDYANQIDKLSNGNIFIVLLLLVIIAPITEELVFRGMILHKANRYVSFIGANILQAVLFGIYHWNIVQGIYAALIGFILGVVYYKFKSIFASMFLHAALNTSSFLVMLFPGHYLAYIILMVTGGILSVGALYLLKPTDTLVPNVFIPIYDTDIKDDIEE